MERKLLLLGLLRQQEMHGYQLYEFIERDLASCTDLKKPTAYYLLGKMAQEGWMSEEQTQEGNRPPRTVYRLTSAGEEAFLSLLKDNLSSFIPANFPGDAGLAFLDVLGAEEAIALLGERRSAMVAALKKLRSAPSHHGSLQLVIRHQERHLEAELEWLDEVIDQLYKTNEIPDQEKDDHHV
jgi:DNA-binding PadR family transcriptional regulator